MCKVVWGKRITTGLRIRWDRVIFYLCLLIVGIVDFPYDQRPSIKI